jgi:pyrroloquinoline quinone (PQQ) biosynthesis protein C
MAVDGRAFLEEMQALVAGKHSKDHALFGMIERGELSREQLKGFVKQFYLLFPKPFPKPIAAMFAKSPEDSELERMWMSNLQEEAAGAETGTAGHKDLYVRFAAAMGIPRDELDATRPLPETAALLHWRELLISQRSWLETYACQGLALEGTASGRMHRVVAGLVDHYGFERDTSDIEYWTVHMSVDEEHMKVGPYVIEHYAVSDLEQGAVRRALETTLDIFWLVYDGIVRAFVGNDPVYAAWREGAKAGV